MTLLAWITLFACAAQAMLAFLALRARDPLARPLALLSIDLLVWNFADLAYRASGRSQRFFHDLDLTASPFTPAFGLHFVVVFVGQRRALGRALAAAYLYFGLISASSATAFVPELRRLELSSTAWWAVLFLGGVAVVALAALGLLVAHLRSAADAEERARTRLLLLALPLGATFGATDLVHLVEPTVPELSSLGTLSCALLTTVVALRLRLFGRNLSIGVAAYAAVMALIAVAGFYATFHALPASAVLVLLGAAALLVVGAAAMREVIAATVARRVRVEEFALLGRFSAQMAHDLKNPLAAIKGAIQFLREEHAQGRTLDAHADFLDLVAEETDRLQRSVDCYQRLGRVEPICTPVDLGELVGDLAALQAPSAGGVELRVSVEPGLPPALADRDLIARATNNLMQNALEAMPRGGTLTLGVAHAGGDKDGALLLTVEDTGEGMDARTRERAFDDFFTTKATGSGLGLSFVRRVVEAHGGTVSLTSKVGRGSVVALRLPVLRAE